MKARKWTIAGVSAGLLAGGAAGFMVAVPGGAGASPARPAITASDLDTETADDGIVAQHHGVPHMGPEARADKVTEVLQGLVDFGVIDASELDAIVTALTTRPDTPPTERPEPGTMLTSRLQALVDAGTLTAEQRDTVVTTLEAARPAEGERGGRGGREGRGPGHARGAHLETAASVIGVTADDLKTALQNGQSIADVATANGVDPQAVIDALVAEASSNLTQRITDMVNGVRPAGAPSEAPAN